MLDPDRWPALFPERPTATPEEIGRRMGELRFTQSPDPHLHFHMLAPTGWRWRPTGEAGNPPGLLASLVSDSAATAEIAVFVDEVPREVHPADWTLLRLERAGHTLQAKRQASTPIGTMADLLTRRESPSPPVFARTNMAKDGKHIFTITCSASEPDYPRWAGDFTAILASFKLTSPERAPLAEPLSSYCYLYPAVVGFSYPASFTVTEETLTPTTCDARLDSIESNPEAGSLHLEARADVRPRKLAADHFAALPHEGQALADDLDLQPCPPPAGFDEAWTITATTTHAGRAIESFALLVTTPKTTLLLARSGPPRATSPFDWMVVDRAFDIARNTLYAV